MKNEFTVVSAIQEVIDYNTLPPQIDYTTPYKIKADRAMKFLQSCSKRTFKMAMTFIENSTDLYYEPDENGVSLAELDAMF